MSFSSFLFRKAHVNQDWLINVLIAMNKNIKLVVYIE